MKNIIFCTAKGKYIADFNFNCNISISYHKIKKYFVQENKFVKMIIMIIYQEIKWMSDVYINWYEDLGM